MNQPPPDLARQWAPLEPLVRRVIRRRWEGAGGDEAAEDLLGEARLALLQRLQAGSDGVRDWEAYAVRTAHRTCDAALRRKYPRRMGLRARLTDLLRNQTPHTGFALWPGAPGERWCGFAAWEGGQGSRGGRLPELLRAPRAVFDRLFPGEDPDRLPLGTLVAALLDWVGRPIELDDLTTATAAILRVREAERADPAVGEDGAARDPAELQRDRRADTAAAVEGRSFLARLWPEIRDLPPYQRAALLLNLRDCEGVGVLELLVLQGVCSFPELVAAIGVPEERLGTLWDGIPLDDLTIAELLGCTRQQVINLRSSARKRLERRLREAG